jgi:hypothetical protein
VICCRTATRRIGQYGASENFISRRAFLNGSLLAFASALAAPLAGCDSGGLFIPCLGPAPPPTPVPGMTYIKASEIGCALDCDLRTGRNKFTGGDATDDAPRINAAMAGASAENPITLIIDGSALVSGLFLPAGGHWSIAGLGCGTGFFLKSASNNDCIHNGPVNAAFPFDPGTPPPPRGMNVSLSNFTINGNRGNGYSGASTTGIPQGFTGSVWFCGINLMNLDNITIEKVVLVNTPAYHVRLSNVGHVSVSGCVMISHGWNTDGLHFDGPANDIAISDCQIETGDDSIALNCPEGHGGNISRVVVTNCTFNGFSLMRLYTTFGGPAKFSIDSVEVTNCTGQLRDTAFNIGLAGGSDLNSVASLNVSNCTLTAPMVLGIAENFGRIVLSNVTLKPWNSQIIWFEPQPTHNCAFIRPSPAAGNVTYVGSDLILENCKIVRSGDLNCAALILDNNSIINNLAFNGFTVQNHASVSPLPNLLSIQSGSISQLVVSSVDSSNFTPPVSEGGFANVASVSGSGVLATGWQFPDNVMADGVPYISANSGRPSIKIGGVVQPYPGLFQRS